MLHWKITRFKHSTTFSHAKLFVHNFINGVVYISQCYPSMHVKKKKSRAEQPAHKECEERGVMSPFY